MTFNHYLTLTTVKELQHMEKGQHGRSKDVTNQPTPDSVSSSNGASPTTPFDHRPFTFSNYENQKQFVENLSNLPTPHLEDKPCLETGTVATMTIDPQPICNYQHQQNLLRKAYYVYGGDTNNNTMVPQHTKSNHHNMYSTSDLTTMPETTSTDYDGDSNSISNKNNTNDSPLFNASSTVSDNGRLLACDHDYDSTSIGNSSNSIDCTDFPSPPSSTPSLVPRLKIQTNMQQQQASMETITTYPLQTHQGEPILSSPNQSTTQPIKKMAVSSRFKEVFDIEGTDLEWDYDINYRQQTYNSSPIDQLPSKSTFPCVSPTSTNDHHYLYSKPQLGHIHPSGDDIHGSLSSGHSKKISGFISTIGRSTSTSSSPPTTAISKRIAPETPVRSLSTSSSSSYSIRGLMRSLSTTATNHYRQPKMILTNTAIEEDGMTKAAQIVAATAADNDTINTLTNDDASLFTATSTDGRRRKISHLLSNAIKKTPARRHTTKIVNMHQPTTAKKLVRRTVIYVNSDESTSDVFTDIMKQYQPHRPAPNPPCPYRYGKRLPPIPTQQTTSSSSSSSPRSSTSSASRLSSSSSSSFASTPTSSPLTSDQRNAPYLEGLELREMEDGSMEWGIIQKKGRRKSFFPMTDQQLTSTSEDDHSDNEEPIEQRVLALMGLEPDHLEKLTLNRPPPIPRRSPQRKPSIALTTNGVSESGMEDDESTTDTYYAHDMNLPNLLRLMSQQHDNNNNNNNNNLV